MQPRSDALADLRKLRAGFVEVGLNECNGHALPTLTTVSTASFEYFTRSCRIRSLDYIETVDGQKDALHTSSNLIKPLGKITMTVEPIQKAS